MTTKATKQKTKTKHDSIEGNGNGNDHTIGVRVPAQVWEKLKEMAGEDDRTPSQVVRRILKEALGL